MALLAYALSILLLHVITSFAENSTKDEINKPNGWNVLNKINTKLLKNMSQCPHARHDEGSGLVTQPLRGHRSFKQKRLHPVIDIVSIEP
uniref:Lipocalin n=1 Tax=Rhipicephalus zambeziensis TaxID=60191 RepID=A0A224YNS4_9ACAR